MKKESFFKRKKFTAGLSVVSVIAGFFLMNQSFTGNAIVTETSTFNPVSLVGLLLVFCAAVLAFYSVRN